MCALLPSRQGGPGQAHGLGRRHTSGVGAKPKLLHAFHMLLISLVQSRTPLILIKLRVVDNGMPGHRSMVIRKLQVNTHGKEMDSRPHAATQETVNQPSLQLVSIRSDLCLTTSRQDSSKEVIKGQEVAYLLILINRLQVQDVSTPVELLAPLTWWPYRVQINSQHQEV